MTALALQATLFDFAISELVLPIDGVGGAALAMERLAQALEQVGLAERVVAERERWQVLDALVAIPWRAPTGAGGHAS